MKESFVCLWSSWRVPLSFAGGRSAQQWFDSCRSAEGNTFGNQQDFIAGRCASNINPRRP
jgi:hypothetical protein